MKPYYSHGGITIYHGDCREVLPQVGHFDCFVTDPYYGIDGGRGGQVRERGKGLYEKNGWEDTEEAVAEIASPTVRALVATGARGAVTCGNRCMYLYERPSDIGCFWSPADSGFGPWGMICFHPILYYGTDWRAGKGAWPSSRYIQGNAPKNGHPCPKPIKEWSWLVAKVGQPGETVVDPFVGSGTTLEAAKNLKMTAIGIEIEEKYCEIAAKRLSQEVFDFGHGADV